ncbi:protein translocase subunit SecD [uncultured Ferrovibrio sp.]|jgi:SecD/SecF fusion protein|uniref:protein translocase subunit SecD n=1 Tax=uncultured Ferrovibrio sp. TaxID=1576913 RepID=UPI00260C688C|nr:protein translocase subunit SecD [uncultured Ferrovibrio sp.]
MLYFAPWKTVLVVLVTLAGLITAAPNLLTRQQHEALPSWMQLPQVNLGLDLRGGAHLLLEVDTSAVLRERLEAVVEGAREELRKERIGYTNLSIVGGNSVGLRLRDPSQAERARPLLAKLGQPVQGGAFSLGAQQTDLQLEISPEGVVRMTLSEVAVRERARSAVAQSMEIVRRRIDQTGVNEPTIQVQGSDRILVQLPGVDDPDRIKRLLGTTAKLTFRMVDTTADPNGPPPPGTEILEGDKPRLANAPVERYVVRRKVEVAGDNLVDAQAGYDQRTGQPVVNFRFDSTGAKRFAEVTQQAVGLPFAIVLDNKVLSAPVIREPILGGSGQISGNFSVVEANDLAVLLRAGALPAPLKVIEERVVGPDLGADAIRAGIIATIIGFVLVNLFMIAAYGLFGVFAVIAVAVNLVLILGILSSMQATLSLPGIAGILLTIGMAVDANVLINERIREEYKLGKSVVASLDAGFNRAFSTILDSNLTTLIAMAILFAVGSGPVRGFAVAISIGILTSMFTAILGVRLMMVLWLRATRAKALAV